MGWAPAFREGKWGGTARERGPAMALAFGFSGALATLGSGFAADYLWARGVRGSHFLLATAALLLAAPFGVFAFLSPSPWLFLTGISVVYFASALCLNMEATS